MNRGVLQGLVLLTAVAVGAAVGSGGCGEDADSDAGEQANNNAGQNNNAGLSFNTNITPAALAGTTWLVCRSSLCERWAFVQFRSVRFRSERVSAIHFLTDGRLIGSTRRETSFDPADWDVNSTGRLDYEFSDDRFSIELVSGFNRENVVARQVQLENNRLRLDFVLDTGTVYLMGERPRPAVTADTFRGTLQSNQWRLTGDGFDLSNVTLNLTFDPQGAVRVEVASGSIANLPTNYPHTYQNQFGDPKYIVCIGTGTWRFDAATEALELSLDQWTDDVTVGPLVGSYFSEIYLDDFLFIEPPEEGVDWGSACRGSGPIPSGANPYDASTWGP